MSLTRPCNRVGICDSPTRWGYARERLSMCLNRLKGGKRVSLATLCSLTWSPSYSPSGDIHRISSQRLDIIGKAQAKRERRLGGSYLLINVLHPLV